MKKTLIALLALSSVAMADTEVLTLPTNVSKITGGQINSNRPFEQISNYTVTKVESIISQIGTVEGGNVYWGTCQGANPGDDVSALTIVPGMINVAMKARSGYAGEWVMVSVVAPENTTALTLNFTPDKTVGCAIFNYNTENSTLTLLNTPAIYSGNQAAIVTAEELALGTNDIIMLAIGTQVSGGATGGATVNLQNMKLTATVASPVPEPTTGSLSLLALAGLCARRRKK